MSGATSTDVCVERGLVGSGHEPGNGPRGCRVRRSARADVACRCRPHIRGIQVVRVAGRHAAGAFEHVVRPERADRIEGPGRAWVLAVDPQPAGSPRGAASVYFHELDVDLDGLPESLLLRPVAAGDVLETAERGTRKVRAIMQDRRVPLRLRESWPVLVDRERVLWVPGVARAGGLAGAERAQRRVRFAWYLRHR